MEETEEKEELEDCPSCGGEKCFISSYVSGYTLYKCEVCGFRDWYNGDW